MSVPSAVLRHQTPVSLLPSKGTSVGLNSATSTQEVIENSETLRDTPRPVQLGLQSDPILEEVPSPRLSRTEQKDCVTPYVGGKGPRGTPNVRSRPPTNRTSHTREGGGAEGCGRPHHQGSRRSSPLIVVYLRNCSFSLSRQGVRSQRRLPRRRCSGSSRTPTVESWGVRTGPDRRTSVPGDSPP